MLDAQTGVFTSYRIAEQLLLDLYVLIFLAVIPSTKLRRLNLITRTMVQFMCYVYYRHRLGSRALLGTWNASMQMA